MSCEEKLMRKYHYGYTHAKDLLNEPYVKDLQKEIKRLQRIVDDYWNEKMEREEQDRLDWLIEQEESFNDYSSFDYDSEW